MCARLLFRLVIWRLTLYLLLEYIPHIAQAHLGLELILNTCIQDSERFTVKLDSMRSQ